MELDRTSGVFHICTNKAIILRGRLPYTWTVDGSKVHAEAFWATASKVINDGIRNQNKIGH